VGWQRPTWCGLCLGPRPQGRTANRPPCRLQGYLAGRRLWRLSRPRRCGEVQLAFCWSHVRRRFYELVAAGPAPIASETLERIAGLYAIEKDIRGRSADERRAVRQDRSRLIIDEFEPWLRAKLALISQKTKLAEAIRYALSAGTALPYPLPQPSPASSTTAASRSIPM